MKDLYETRGYDWQVVPMPMQTSDPSTLEWHAIGDGEGHWLGYDEDGQWVIWTDGPCIFGNRKATEERLALWRLEHPRLGAK